MIEVRRFMAGGVPVLELRILKILLLRVVGVSFENCAADKEYVERAVGLSKAA